MLVADRHLIDRVTPGTRVVAIGIYSVYEVTPFGSVTGHERGFRSSLGMQALYGILISEWSVCAPTSNTHSKGSHASRNTGRIILFDT